MKCELHSQIGTFSFTITPDDTGKHVFDKVRLGRGGRGRAEQGGPELGGAGWCSKGWEEGLLGGRPGGMGWEGDGE